MSCTFPSLKIRNGERVHSGILGPIVYASTTRGKIHKLFYYVTAA